MKINLLLIALLCTGCAINSSTESVTVSPDRSVTYTVEDWNGYFLYWSKYKNHDRRTEFSSNETSGFESKPDAESIGAVAEGVVTGLKGGL